MRGGTGCAPGIGSGELPFGVALYGKTLGIVGLGRIGVAVARRAQASGMKVIYNDCVRRKDEADLNVTYAGFDDLLASPILFW